MSRVISLASAALGAALATAGAGTILIQQSAIPGSFIFPMPFFVLVEWAALGIAGAVYVSLAELRLDDRQLQGAWAVIGAYIPLVLLGAFSIGPIALVSAVLLLVPTTFLTLRRGSPILRQLGILVIGALVNLVILIALIALIALGGITIGAVGEQTRISVGVIQDYPVDTATPIELKTSFLDPDPAAIGSKTPGVVTQPASATISPVPVFLVHDPTAGILALYNRDPHLGCRVTWEAENHLFMNPCHGEQYSLTGECIAGPCPRGLDRFKVIVTEEGEVWVDVGDFQLGPARPN